MHSLDRHRPASGSAPRAAWFATLLVIVGALPGAGCRFLPSREPDAASTPELEQAERLSYELRAFSGKFHTTLAGVGSTIAAESRDPLVRERSLRWRIQAIPLVATASLETDPRVGLEHIWAICARQRYVAESAEPPMMGDQNETMVETARQLEASIEEIARQYMPADRFEMAKAKIDETVRSEDVLQMLDVGAPVHRAEDGSNAFTSLLGLPLAPLRGMQGIGDTPQELHYLGRVAGAWLEHAQVFPEIARWHMELLVMSLDDMPTLQRVQQAAQGFAELKTTLDGLPQAVGSEVRATLDSAEGTVASLRETAADARAVSEHVEATTNLAREALDAARPTAEALTTTVESATELLREVRVAFPPREGAEPSQRMTVDDVTEAAQQFAVTVHELRELVADVQSAANDGTVPALEQTAQSTLLRASETAGDLVDRAFVRAIVVLVVLFAFLALLRRVPRRAQPATSTPR